MKTATNLSTGEIYYYGPDNLPQGIDHAAWAVLASFMLENDLSGSFAQNTFTPRKLVMDNIDRFILGNCTIAVDDWCATL